MKTEDVRSIIDMIRDASSANLIILSLFLLPMLLGVWLLFLNNLRYLDQHHTLKFTIICLLFVAYVVGLIIMRYWDPREEKLRRARYHVENRLKNRRGHRASFDAITSEVNKAYTVDFLSKLIDKNPEVFRKCRIKLKSGDKDGMTLVRLKEMAQRAQTDAGGK